MFMLGQIYEYGEVVEEDLNEAVKFYKAAAAEGNTDAIKRLKKGKFKRYL